MPPRSLAAIATFTSQLLGIVAFALAVAWICKHGDRRPASFAILVLGPLCVFAAGNALRGSVRALALCALLDVAAAIVCLGNIAAAKAFVLAPIAWAAPAIANQLAFTIAGVLAGLAACACVVAVPQIRQLAAWRNEQIMHVAR
jgi:hypothetical protein